MARYPITETVDEILASTIKNPMDGSVQTAGRFIFNNLDSTLTHSQKRAFLIAVEGMSYKDNRGQDKLKPTFTLIETGAEPALVEEVISNLSTLCEIGLLNLLSDKPRHYEFTDLGGVSIGNYITLREFHEGGGRAKLSPDLSHKRVVFPNIPVNAKSFVQLLKSIQRRLYEAQTGSLLRFQDKDVHDYESTTRVAYSLQAPQFFIDPAISFEIIPLEPSRVKVIAECYHILAEESFNAALWEIGETWPGETANIITQILSGSGQMTADEPPTISIVFSEYIRARELTFNGNREAFRNIVEWFADRPTQTGQQPGHWWFFTNYDARRDRTHVLFQTARGSVVIGWAEAINAPSGKSRIHVHAKAGDWQKVYETWAIFEEELRQQGWIDNSNEAPPNLSIPNTPEKPGPSSGLDKWFDYYHECKGSGIHYTLRQLARDTHRSYGAIRQEHGRYKDERDIPPE